MALPFREPPSIEAEQAHAADIARCRGSACYVAIARHFGSEAPNVLERRIDGRAPYVNEGQKSWSRKYRKWITHGRVPSPDTCELVWKMSGQSVDLRRWRDLFLWELLSLTPPSLERIHAEMAAMPLQIRRKLCAQHDDDGFGRFVRSEFERETVLSIRNLGSLNAFIALLCLSREGEIINSDPHHYLPAFCAFDMLPRILYSYPELRYCWEQLFECLRMTYWNRKYVHNMTLVPRKETIVEHLATLDANPHALIAPKSGIRGPRPRFDNLDPLKEYREAVNRIFDAL
jgi:hypothetical protein